MKRFLLTWAIIIFAMALAACHETPETAVVIKKDTATLLEMAQKSEPQSDQSLSEQYDIPERYQFEMEASNGNLSVKVDADVIVPEGSRMLIYRVQGIEFSQEIVKNYFYELCGDTDMWLEAEPTKNEIKEAIIRVKSRIAELEANPQLAKEPDDQMWLEADLSKLEQQFITAPDTVERVKADGMLIETVFDSDTSATGFTAFERSLYSSNWGKYFFVNNDAMWNTFHMGFANMNICSKLSTYNSPALPVLDDNDISSEVISQAGLSSSEAKAMVQAFLDKTSTDMAVDSIYLSSDAQIWNNNSDEQSAQYYEYLVYCVRTVDGFHCSYVNEASSSQDMMAAPWWYESMKFSINKNGIAGMNWSSPIEVLEMVNEDAQLLSFTTIQQTFERMMNVTYAAKASKNNMLEFQINRVTLSLHRITEQNANEYGLLIPAWNFYRKVIERSIVNDQVHVEEKTGESMMTINAIDGSVIDNSKGY